jgi:hypothetical protein
MYEVSSFGTRPQRLVVSGGVGFPPTGGEREHCSCVLEPRLPEAGRIVGARSLPRSPRVGERIAMSNAETRCEFWSGRPDLNRGPLAPKASALPGCATPRREQGTKDRRRWAGRTPLLPPPTGEPLARFPFCQALRGVSRRNPRGCCPEAPASADGRGEQDPAAFVRPATIRLAGEAFPNANSGAEVHAGWCPSGTSNPAVPILSGRSVRFRHTSATLLIAAIHSGSEIGHETSQAQAVPGHEGSEAPGEGRPGHAPRRPASRNTPAQTSEAQEAAARARGRNIGALRSLLSRVILFPVTCPL